jgi:hypothetical protein
MLLSEERMFIAAMISLPARPIARLTHRDEWNGSEPTGDFGIMGKEIRTYVLIFRD